VDWETKNLNAKVSEKGDKSLMERKKKRPEAMNHLRKADGEVQRTGSWLKKEGDTGEPLRLYGGRSRLIIDSVDKKKKWGGGIQRKNRKVDRGENWKR